MHIHVVASKLLQQARKNDTLRKKIHNGTLNVIYLFAVYRTDKME